MAKKNQTKKFLNLLKKGKPILIKKGFEERTIKYNRSCSVSIMPDDEVLYKTQHYGNEIDLAAG